MMLVCWNCGESLDKVPRPITRHMYCPDCHEVLHCCRMCKWYAPGRPSDCDHDRADPPVEKESANFCEYFVPRPRAYKPADGERQDVAKSKLSSLFDDEPGDTDLGPDDEQLFPQEKDDVQSRLDDLFDD